LSALIRINMRIRISASWLDAAAIFERLKLCVTLNRFYGYGNRNISPPLIHFFHELDFYVKFHSLEIRF
jgi:hypothetical protein